MESETEKNSIYNNIPQIKYLCKNLTKDILESYVKNYKIVWVSGWHSFPLEDINIASLLLLLSHLVMLLTGDLSEHQQPDFPEYRFKD